MSISDLRQRLKPVPVSAIEEQDKELDQQMGRSHDNPDRLSVEHGKNVFRIYPPHDSFDEKGRVNPFAEPKVITYLPGMVYDRTVDGEIKKDPEGKPLYKTGMKPVFNSKIHGKKDNSGYPVSEDLVDEFIRIAQERGREMDDSSRKQFMLPIYGFYSKDPNKRINGVTYSQTWECYANKISNDGSSKFGLLELKKAVKNRINKISSNESSNEPLGTDPFTDIVEGRGLIIIYNKDADKPEDYYTTEIDSSTEMEDIGGRMVKVLKTYPLSDEQIETFFKKDPLSKIYRNVFTRRDFDLQLAGLTIIDRKYDMKIVDSDEFIRIAEKISSFYPKEESSQEQEETNLTPIIKPSEPAKKVDVKSDLPFEVEEDFFTTMTREELKDFCKDNSTGIMVLPVSKMSDEKLRQELRHWLRASEGKDIHESEEVSDPTLLFEEEKTPPMTARQKLEALKNKI